MDVAVREMSLIDGFVFGFRQPAISAAIVMSDTVNVQSLRRRFRTLLSTRILLSESEPENTGLSPERLFVGDLANAVHAVLQTAGHPVDRRFVCRRSQAQDTRKWQLVLPAFSQIAAQQTLRWVCRMAAALSSSGTRDAFTDDEAAAFDLLLDNLARRAPSGSNARNLLEAAYAASLPVIPLPGGTFQIGWGQASRRFSSSTSDETGTLAMNLSRRKDWTNRLLHMAGLPVPRQFPVRNRDEAVAAANRTGYPTVVKALDLDQGVGIEAGLQDETALCAAYDRVAKASKSIAVESFLPGCDYRLNVLRGKVIGAVHRVPAGVTGDGTSTVQELVARANEDPRRSTRRSSVMKPILLDDEADELLKLAGLSRTSVPDTGTFVQLKRIANVSTGGHTVPVLDVLHPDNRHICEAAATAVGLDIAGVDLIVPDIARSWRETGGGICEVNGRPQIGLTYPHVFRQILNEYVPSKGRIPAFLVLAEPDDPFAQEVSEKILAAQPAFGVTTSSMQWKGGQKGGIARETPLHGARAILMSKSAEGVLAQCTIAELRRDGCPFETIDGLIVLSATAKAAQCVEGLRTIAKQVRGPAIALKGTSEQEMLASVFSGGTNIAVSDPAAMVRVLCKHVENTSGQS